ncbi:MAG: hypothetical protein BGN85_01460 [Alphaproteobacteria bacterium 64-11]|nr:hypothetical protein [Alphaproteobacteria bacterium]OJU12242.1 MAG: hypothetical protein BGN85_01460 [Alphaproteobacteria bacterium 64-11]
MRRTVWLLPPLIGVLAWAASSRADEAPTNAVAVLEEKLESGKVTLKYADDGHGWLESLLAALNISPDTQVLPFTRSSLQFDHINPKAPRAVYFNDDVAVGAVHDGGLIEIIANDRRDGLAFYTLDTKDVVKPRLQREAQRCLSCHGMVNTLAPGWIVANITPTADGTPVFADPAHPFDFTDQTRPFVQRWGGWYVTGSSDGMIHRGNVTAPDINNPFDLPEGRTILDLSGHFDPKETLRPTSDIVALMTLEHQTGFIDRAAALNVRYSDAGLDDLVTYMTFGDEVKLPGPVSGNSGFATQFSARGPRDAKGRSLRDFDLKVRLLRYPLSYMVYSSAFDALKPDIKEKLWRRLYDALKGSDQGREAIAILAATKRGLPDYWK